MQSVPVRATVGGELSDPWAPPEGWVEAPVGAPFVVDREILTHPRDEPEPLPAL